MFIIPVEVTLYSSAENDKSDTENIKKRATNSPLFIITEFISENPVSSFPLTIFDSQFSTFNFPPPLPSIQPITDPAKAPIIAMQTESTKLT